MRWLLLFVLFHPTVRCPLDGADMAWTGEINQDMIAPAVACRYSHFYVRSDGERVEHLAWIKCAKKQLVHPERK